MRPMVDSGRWIERSRPATAASSSLPLFPPAGLESRRFFSAADEVSPADADAADTCGGGCRRGGTGGGVNPAPDRDVPSTPGRGGGGAVGGGGAAEGGN